MLKYVMYLFFVYQEQIVKDNKSCVSDVCTSISSDYTKGIAGLGKDIVCNSEFPPRGKMQTILL